MKVEDGFVINVSKFCAETAGKAFGWASISWHSSHTGEETGSISLRPIFNMTKGVGELHLRYTITNRYDGECRQITERVALEAQPQPFGGWRWHCFCPLSGRCCRKLYMPPGASRFASRQAHRLKYRSQSEAPFERAVSQAQRIRRKLQASVSIGDPVDRPCGMHRQTFQRQTERLGRYESVVEGHIVAFLERVGSRRTKR